MKTTTKAALLSICAVMLALSTVFGTLAYLTSQDTVTNTFTVGNVKITLDEDKVDEAGKPVEGADRVKNNEYKIIPGHTYTKDPIVHIDAQSEDSYVFVYVDNKISAIEMAATEYRELKGDEAAGSYKTIAEQMTANNWFPLTVDDTAVPGVYYYNRIATAEDTDLLVFETFTISGEKLVNGQPEAEEGETAPEKDANGNYYIEGFQEGTTVIVQAFAIQADGFADAAEAWTAGKFTTGIASDNGTEQQ